MASCTDCRGLGYRLRELEQGGGSEALKKIDLGFLAKDWRGLNYLHVIQSGTPGNNEIGPHLLPAGTYNIQIYKFIDTELVREVNTNVIINRTTGLITIWKATRSIAFSGRIVIDYAPI